LSNGSKEGEEENMITSIWNVFFAPCHYFFSRQVLEPQTQKAQIEGKPWANNPSYTLSNEDS